MNSRLGHQCHGHLSVPDVEVERTSPMPTQGLVEFEELFERIDDTLYEVDLSLHALEVQLASPAKIHIDVSLRV
jgi:hypothetical protein